MYVGVSGTRLVLLGLNVNKSGAPTLVEALDAFG
jgi:hypothetical protein